IKGTTTGTITDANGAFQLDGAQSGRQIMVISFVGYATREVVVNVSDGGTTELGNLKLQSQAIGLDEVSVIASVAVDRKTPVAVSTIKGSIIEAKVGNQEFPEMLRSTPSVYVTKQGGGFGDSRINVRGFDQRNTAVMINGIPVNDMENGWVYWSNWAGLSDVTSSMQVQRGLSASKLAITSVGGTINIVTNAAQMEKGGAATISTGNDGYFKFGAVYNTGLSDKGWAFSVQGTHTRGDGYIDGTMFRAYSYFVSAAKKINDKHSVHLTALGAPQWHHQNGFANTIVAYEQYGKKYNSNWGYLDGEEFNITRNFYHKPKIFLNHYWTISEKTELSTSAYVSFGRGGGTGDLGRIGSATIFTLPKTADGLIRFDDIKAWNNGATISDFNGGNPNTVWAGGGGFDGQYVGVNANPGTGIIRRSSMNEHNWYGVLANLTHQINDNITFIGGLDLRKYKGLHYRRVEDLLGLAAFYDDDDLNQPDKYITDEGRKDGNEIDYNNDGLVRWLGAFGQLEFSFDRLSFFASGSYSSQGFKRIDYFLYLDNDPKQETSWENFAGGNAKIGLNYNINSNHNVYFNTGYYSQQPIFDNLYPTFTNDYNPKAENQKVVGLELGYGFRSRYFSSNLNVYSTEWTDRQVTRSFNVNGTPGSATFIGVGQLHQGLEIDFTGSPMPKLTLNGMVSIGNWRYTNNFDANIYDASNVFLGDTTLFLKDFKVGDAAQTTMSLGAEYEIIKNLNLNATYYYADNLYADFNVGSDNSILTPGKRAWQLPTYSLVDVGLSYRFKLGGVGVTWRFNVNNLFDEVYMSESDTNILFDSNNATDSSEGVVGTNGSPRNRVFYGFGRTWNTSLKISF
ncbi:MAG: TonB-dependent receptor, partial [Flammeovirgaceae bacterium]|nr:TonB-dependent receptor [Flammeovirgaceae bacterium]